MVDKQFLFVTPAIGEQLSYCHFLSLLFLKIAHNRQYAEKYANVFTDHLGLIFWGLKDFVHLDQKIRIHEKMEFAISGFQKYYFVELQKA